MRFDLDHDWQGNMSTPSARVGERAKTHFLLILCALWLCLGLVGHSPWKPYESHAISTIKTIIDTGNILTPTAASNQLMLNPPLYYLSAAASAKLFSIGQLLPLHDAARIATGLWMTITLLMIGMTGRELWGKGFGRQTTLIFIGAIGLIVNAHTLTPAVSALTGLASAFYALSLTKRRPYRAGILLGLGLAVSFLSTGFLAFFIITATSFLLPVLFKAWRNKRFLSMLALAILIASPLIAGWILLCQHYHADIFNSWWNQSFNQFNHAHYLYFLETLLWYAWPALPLAVWGAWRFRSQLLHKPRFQLIITFFMLTLVLVSSGADDREVFALPFLIPLTAMAGGSIESLKRGTAGALNWFGLLIFGLISSLIWLGWVAMLTGSPAKIKQRLTFLSGMQDINLNIFAVVIAATMSLIWLLSILRSQHSNRSGATNWAIGLTTVWTLLMTLWLPMIDSARSYQSVFTSIQTVLPTSYACVINNHLGDSQKDLLHYYANIKTQNSELGALNCDVYIAQDDNDREKVTPGADWKLIWSGQRIADRRESFRLFVRK